jgi:hypothetical protein
MHPLDLGAFELESALIEVRYKEALAIWDRAGTLWSEVCRIYPELKIRHGEPNKTTFELDQSIELNVALASSSVMDHNPKDLERLRTISSALFDQVTKTLEVKDYLRVGLRLIYWKDTESEEAAARELYSTGLFNPPSITPLGKESTLSSTDLVTRWETRSAGTTLAIRTQSKRPNIDIPPQVAHLVQLREAGVKHGTLVDIDYFTKGIIASEQLRPKVWIDQAYQAARKAYRSLFEG